MARSTFKDIWFVSGKRTPFGAFGGSFKGFTATDLGVEAAKGAIKQAGISAEEIENVVIGNVHQTSPDGGYIARHIGLRAGTPIPVPAVAVNRLCGSGFESIAQGALMMEAGVAGTTLVGGAESMSQAPFVVREARWGARMGHVKFEDSLMAGLTDSYTGLPMAITAENLAESHNLNRVEVDKYACQSQERTQEALKQNLFDEEIEPVSWEHKKKGTITVEKDEHPRPQTTLETLSSLKPVFKENGVVTAGNASGMVDGAAAMVLMTGEKVKQKNITPLGRLVGWGVAGCDPKVMGIGPVPAAKEVFQATGLNLNDMDLVEINEAFSAQYLAVEKDLELNRDISNVNGGSIGIGHPLGATGTRLTMTALYELRRRKKRYALVGACIGGGQGLCLILENAQ